MPNIFPGTRNEQLAAIADRLDAIRSEINSLLSERTVLRRELFYVRRSVRTGERFPRGARPIDDGGPRPSVLIRDLLRQHPEGLRPVEIYERLDVSAVWPGQTRDYHVSRIGQLLVGMAHRGITEPKKEAGKGTRYRLVEAS